jgi:hypothetical protein
MNLNIQQVLSERQTTHGDFADHAQTTQLLKTVMHSQPGWSKLSAMQRESLDMIVHKIGRVLSGNPNHADHWVDIQGYARLIEERL